MRIYSIQSLRFIAALLVVYYHAANLAHLKFGDFGSIGNPGAQIGPVGVDIFFVISGFIMFRTARDLSAATFLRRRAQRILPLYAALALPYTLVAAIQAPFGWRDLLATCLLWPATDRLTMPTVPVAWTLCFEAVFYEAFALTLWRPKLIWILAPLYLTSLCLPSIPVMRFVGNPVILEFLAGGALASLPQWRPAKLGILAGSTILLSEYMMHAPISQLSNLTWSGLESWNRVFYFGIPATLIVWGTTQLDIPNGVTAYLGDTSYALYLFHPALAAFAINQVAFPLHLPTDLAIIAAILASILISWRIHELFEKPMLKYFKLVDRGASQRT